MGVGRAGDAGLQQCVMGVHGFQYVDHEGHEAQVVFRRLTRSHQKDSGIGSQRPVIVLAGTVHAFERFLVQQDTEPMFARDLAHQGHDQ